MSGAALITGAGGGIGSQIAKRFAADGYAVIVGDIDLAAAERVADEIGAGVTALELDVTKRDHWDAAVERARELGGLAVTVNNAGIVRDATLKKMTDEQWDEVIDVHLRGAYLGCQTSLIEMSANQGGRIVNISSIAYLGSFGQANYAAAKGGIVSLTRTVAVEGARKGVLCNAVAPGNIDTPMFRGIPQDFQDRFIEATPLGRLADPAEVAAVVSFLAGPDSSYVTGQVINIDGGVTAKT